VLPLVEGDKNPVNQVNFNIVPELRSKQLSEKFKEECMAFFLEKDFQTPQHPSPPLHRHTRGKLLFSFLFFSFLHKASPCTSEDCGKLPVPFLF
jgi:hypothetical protein